MASSRILTSASLHMSRYTSGRQTTRQNSWPWFEHCKSSLLVKSQSAQTVSTSSWVPQARHAGGNSGDGREAVVRFLTFPSGNFFWTPSVHTQAPSSLSKCRPMWTFKGTTKLIDWLTREGSPTPDALYLRPHRGTSSCPRTPPPPSDSAGPLSPSWIRLCKL